MFMTIDDLLACASSIRMTQRFLPLWRQSFGARMAVVACTATFSASGLGFDDEESLQHATLQTEVRPGGQGIEVVKLPIHSSVVTTHDPSRRRLDGTGIGVRWSMSNGSTSLGFGVGAFGYGRQESAIPRDPAYAATAIVPALSLGLRYRATDTSELYADAFGARGIGMNRTDGYFTNLGVEWKSPKSRVNFLRGGLNYQLDNGARMTLKLRRSVISLSLRSEF